MPVQSQGYSPPGSEKLTGWSSVSLGVEYWGALESGEGCEMAAQVHAHWAEPRGQAGPGHSLWHAPEARPASGAVAAGDWALVWERGCWSISGVLRAVRGQRAGLEPGLGAEKEEKGFGQMALVTGRVDAETFLENSGSQDGQGVGFQVSEVLEQAF